MPLYEVEHSIPLEKSERDQLAQEITRIHARKFTTPSLFVNIRFIDANSQTNYVGGKERSINRILAHVRTGGDRSTDDFGSVAALIHTAWFQIINRKGTDDRTGRELSAVFILGDIITGIEKGLLIPKAGEDAKWLKDHYEVFEERAGRGDEDFAGLIEELRTRTDLVAKLQQ
ncbi:hypothetical protein ASPWEDRAFT_174779 [Aspergillus wentii DTO 134E9]|uniref:Tautomerase cis-CaaD-like domain-containing protein n=1 Tax=Aspergillus wentii DTO 134E9 TaxID=1073089 RepID=A0A1L9REL8_ASPWE|nr:uncharacterized protein ASPWEDRAFT_174779 [Aspergillus wentii DTO 134E9]KAI9933617.1 hypothetical protein MW887_008090 [Aspergillus wentii]OJJ33370.1 hypothetical protein ASPWEDRAFT_174779 [Aspergillus wentii DTO 134E9]